MTTLVASPVAQQWENLLNLNVNEEPVFCQTSCELLGNVQLS